MKRKLFAAGAAAMLFAAGVLSAQNAQRLKRADNTFFTDAAQGGMAEVQMGQLAQQHATSEAVKRFGQRMIDDHSKGGEELKTLASQKGLTVPPAIDAKEKATFDRLSQLNGAAFDRAYMEDMVKDHQEDIAEFQREANNGADADLKAFAAKMLPTLQEHLKMAQDTRGQIQ